MSEITSAKAQAPIQTVLKDLNDELDGLEEVITHLESYLSSIMSEQIINEADPKSIKANSGNSTLYLQIQVFSDRVNSQTSRIRMIIQMVEL